MSMARVAQDKLRGIDHEVMYCGPFYDLKYTRCPHSEAGNGHADHNIDIGRLQQLFGADWYNRLLFQASWKFGPTTKTHHVTIHLAGDCATVLSASDFESGGRCYPQDATPDSSVHVHISKRPLPPPDPTWPAPIVGYVPQKLSSRLLTCHSMYRPVPGHRRPAVWADGIRRGTKANIAGILDDATMADSTAPREDMSEDDNDEVRQHETQDKSRFKSDSSPDLPPLDSEPQSAITARSTGASRESTRQLPKFRDTMVDLNILSRDHGSVDSPEAGRAANKDNGNEPIRDSGDNISPSIKTVTQQHEEIARRERAGRSSTVPPSMLTPVQPSSAFTAAHSRSTTPTVRSVYEDHPHLSGNADQTAPQRATALQDHITVPQSPAASYCDIHGHPSASHGTPDATIPYYSSGQSPTACGVSKSRINWLPPSADAARPSAPTTLDSATVGASTLEDRMLALRGQGTPAPTPLDPSLSDPKMLHPALLPKSHPGYSSTYNPRSKVEKPKVNRSKVKKIVDTSFPKALDGEGIGASISREFKPSLLTGQQWNVPKTYHEGNKNAPSSGDGPQIPNQAAPVMPRISSPYPYETELTPHHESHQALGLTSASPKSSVAPMSIGDNASEAESHLLVNHEALQPPYAAEPNPVVKEPSATPKSGGATNPEYRFIHEFSTQRQKVAAAQSNPQSPLSPIRPTGNKNKALRIDKPWGKKPRHKALTPVETQKLIDSARASNSLSPKSTSQTQHLPKSGKKAPRASDTIAETIAKKLKEESAESSPSSVQPSLAPNMNALSGLPMQKPVKEAEVYNEGRMEDGRDFTFDTLSLPIAENEHIKDDDVKTEDS